MVRRLPTPAATAGRSGTPAAAAISADLARTDLARTDHARPSPGQPGLGQPSFGQDDEAARALPPARPAVIAPLSPERYKVQLTITRDTHDKLRRAQDLMRHVVPDGDPAVIFDRALDALLDVLEKRKLARTKKPRPPRRARQQSRHVPADVKRKVWARDGGRCTFVGTDGRCSARSFLELHHIVPYADGGATDAANLTLRCRAHNQHDAAVRFGTWTLREHPLTYELGSNRVTRLRATLQPATTNLEPPSSSLPLTASLPATIGPP
jgi:hypothetical protein